MASQESVTIGEYLGIQNFSQIQGEMFPNEPPIPWPVPEAMNIENVLSLPATARRRQHVNRIRRNIERKRILDYQMMLTIQYLVHSNDCDKILTKTKRTKKNLLETLHDSNRKLINVQNNQ
jgi:hypothetical protein